MAPAPDAILSFAAAFPLMFLGGLLLFIRPFRSTHVYFALFAIAFGAEIAIMNAGRLQSDPAFHHQWLLAGHAVMAIATLFLVHFTMIVRRRPYSKVVSYATLAFTAVASLVLALRPDLIVTSVVWEGDVRATYWGPLVFAFFQAPQRIALLLAVLVVYREYRLAKAGTPRRRFRGMLIAFALLVTYQITQAFAALVADPGGTLEFASGSVAVGPVTATLTVILYLLVGWTLIGVIAHLVLRPPPPEGTDSALVFAFIFPATVAVVEIAMNALFNIRIETKGFWHILAVGVLVYTLANFQLFDLELRAKRFAGPVVAGILALFGIPILLTLAVGELGVKAFTIALIPEVIGVAGVIVFHDRVGKALFPGVEETPDYVHQRRLDIYRVALEETLEHGGSTEDRHLKELRLKHGISNQEHAIISWMVSSDHGPQAKTVAEGPFEVGQTVLDRYRLMRLIGKGTYGRTFLASDSVSKHEVALKTVDLETFDGAAARLLLREARLAASLDHPFIIDILDVAELPDRVVVVMEYANTNLEQHLNEEGRLRLPAAVRFLRELLMALETVHEHGIVHRNMKPKNLLLEADGSLRLSDFGAAHSEQTGASARTELATRTLQDILYQSPEQIHGDEASPQSDLFVAGVLFHVALTRRHPFPVAGKDDHRIRAVILEAPPELHVGREEGWVAPFLERALAKDPADRYRSAVEMRKTLEEMAGI